MLALPVATLSLEALAHITRITRSSMIEVLKTPYVRTARLKGLRRDVVLFKHALRNAMLPTVTVIAFNIGWMLGGVVVVEQVFSYPGLGSLVLFAIQQRDIPLLQASISPGSPFFVDFVGVLDGNGAATPILVAPYLPFLDGLPLYFAGFSLVPTVPLERKISNWIRVTLTL